MADELHKSTRPSFLQEHWTLDGMDDVEHTGAFPFEEAKLGRKEASMGLQAHKLDIRRRSMPMKAISYAVCMALGGIFLLFVVHQQWGVVLNSWFEASGRVQSTCRYETMNVRREWSSLLLDERIAYTDAVSCLFDKPSRLPRKIYPGARNRHDDFLALHINMTLKIHFSGLFLPWHRHYIYLYHQALSEECGYTGALPYWDWQKYAHNIYGNALFDGGPGSMSGDGLSIPHSGVDIGFGEMPKGHGGGCIVDGPFKGAMQNMGPIGYDVLRTAHGILPPHSFDYNPRCLKRDLNPTLAALNHNETVIYNLINKTPALPDFQFALSGAFGPIVNNPHAAGHFIVGGAGNDFFASAGDPTFYLHHSELDRMWAKWQSLDKKSRLYALSGTNTILNDPPSPETSLDDVLDMGVEDMNPPRIRDVMARDGPLYCYRYDDESREAFV